MSASEPLRSDLPLLFRVGAPAGTRPRRLLVLLHGVGGNETDLRSLAARVDDADTLVVLPRAPLTFAPGQYAWFPVRFEADGPRIDFDQAERSRALLQDFIALLQREHAIAPSHTVVAGFSQGGIMSAGVGLTAPARVAGFGVLCGRILPELEPRLADAPSLRAVHGFIGHGRDDDKLPVAWARRTHDWLTRLAVPHETRLYPHGHALSAAMQDDFLAWLRRGDQRWNQPG